MESNSVRQVGEGAAALRPQNVWVMPSTELAPRCRAASPVLEWRVEAVMGTDNLALTVYLPGQQEATFLLQPEDSSDMACVLSRLSRLS